jgi:hypothetical protein
VEYEVIKVEKYNMLINDCLYVCVLKRQDLEPSRGSSNKKKTDSIRSCVNWAFKPPLMPKKPIFARIR